MEKQWKLVESAARHTARHLGMHLMVLLLVWKLLNIEHYPLYSSNDRCAHSETLAPELTANVILFLLSNWK
jgi:hypothetical protein